MECENERNVSSLNYVSKRTKSFSQEEKPSNEKSGESKPEVTTSDQSAEDSEKPRGNDEGSGNQEEKKKEQRPQLTIEKVGNFTYPEVCILERFSLECPK